MGARLGFVSRKRNWTAVGLGVEVLAGVAILISPWLAIPIALGGVGIIAWGLYPHKIERVISRVLPSRIPNKDADPYIPLKEAATIAYEEMRGTQAGTIIEGPNPDNVLGYYAHALFNGKTTLYGNHPPSRKLEAVPNEEYGRCGFSDDQNALRRHGENRNLYENLQIKRSDLDRRIAELKSAATARHEVRLSDALYWITGNAAWEPGHSPDSHLALAAIEVRQAARDAEITIRGRREIDRDMPGETFDKTWEDIERSHWNTHEIDVGGVMIGGYAHRETSVISPGDLASESMPHYGMLRIYKHEMETRWLPASEPNISVWLAMRWLADPKNLSEFIGNIQPFCQKTFEEKITVWGKEAVYSRRKKLPTGYWEFYTICPDSLFRESSHGATSELLDKNLKNVTMPKMIKLETIWWQVERYLKGNGDGARQISQS